LENQDRVEAISSDHSSEINDLAVVQNCDEETLSGPIDTLQTEHEKQKDECSSEKTCNGDMGDYSSPESESSMKNASKQSVDLQDSELKSFSNEAETKFCSNSTETEQMQQAPSLTQTNLSLTYDTSITKSVGNDEDDDLDFGEFERSRITSSCVNNISSQISTAGVSNSIPVEPTAYDFADFKAFESSPAPSKGEDVKTSYIGTLQEDDNDDDDGFGDFTAAAAVPATETDLSISDRRNSGFSSFPTAVVNEPPVPSKPSLYEEIVSDGNKRVELLKTVYPVSNEQSSIDSMQEKLTMSCRPIQQCIMEDNQWTHVQDFDASQCLLFKWVTSSAQQQLLKSLSIDTSSIVSCHFVSNFMA